MIHKYFTTSLLYSYMIYCFAYRGRKYTQLIQCNVKAFYSDNHIQCYKQTTVKIFLNRHLYKTVTQSKSLQFLSLHPLFEFPLDRHLSKMYTYRGFIKVLNRRATEFDTRAKNWQGPPGLAPQGGPVACSPGKF